MLYGPILLEKTIKLWKVGKMVLSTSDVASRFVAAEGRIPTIRSSQWSLLEAAERVPEEDQSASVYDDDGAVDETTFDTGSRQHSPRRALAVGAYRGGTSPTHRLHPYCRNVFADAHTYHINSLSCCMDGQTFLSADDLRIYWWHMDRSDTCFSKDSLHCMMHLRCHSSAQCSDVM